MKSKDRYKLTNEEREFLHKNNELDLSAQLLHEDDREGPAHEVHGRHVHLRVTATVEAFMGLAPYYIKRERQEGRRAFFSSIPLIRRLVKERP